MIIKAPIEFDDGSTFDPSTTPTPHKFSKPKNGSDFNGRRVTNIVGHDGTKFLKRCPKCNNDKPETDFGYNGRDTGESTRRDQSYCTSCRGNY